MFIKKSRCLFKLSALPFAMFVVPAASFALSSLSEDELSHVNAQDGLVYNLTAPTLSATEFSLKTGIDPSSPEGLASTPAQLQADPFGGIRTSPLRMSTPGGTGNMASSWVLDAGANASGPAASIVGHMDRYRLGGETVAGVKHGYISALVGDTDRSFGEWALVSDMDFSLQGQGLLLNGGKSYLKLAYNDAALFWRQNEGHATLALSNIDFLWETPAGSVGIDQQGLRLASDTTTFRISLDAYYKNNADQDMTALTVNDRPGIRYSWGGTLYDTVLYARSGGAWNTASTQATNVAFAADGKSTLNLPAGFSSGVNLGMRWNYRDEKVTNPAAGDFLWSIGNIKPMGRGNAAGDGDQEYLEFGDWKNLEQASGAVPGRYGFDMPLLAYDALAAGAVYSPTTDNAGGSLCWGGAMSGAACATTGKLLRLAPGTVEGYDASGSDTVNRTGGALFMDLIRDGNLLAWSNRVRVIHIDPVSGQKVYDDTPAQGGNADGSGYSWGLISTMANMNANIYFYPGGSETPGSGNRKQGAMGDLLFTSQSFDSPNFKNWNFDVNNPDPVKKAAAVAAKALCDANASSTACNNARWSQGTHFMLADTAKQMGVGFLGTSILIAADDLRLWLKDTTGDASPNNATGGIDLFSPRVRYNLSGLLGGARLPNGHDLIRVANIDMNLEGLLNFRLYSAPTNVQSGKKPDSNDYLGYSGAIRLRCGNASNFGCTDNVFTDSVGSTTASGKGSYIHIEEPGKEGTYLAFDDLSGDLAMTEGAIQLRAAANDNTNTAPNSGNKFSTDRADLNISNKILMGASAGARLTDGVAGAGVGAGGAAGRPMTGNIRFSGNDIMSMAIPAASAYYSLTVRAQ